jgi:hypothetical protein
MASMDSSFEHTCYDPTLPSPTFAAKVAITLRVMKPDIGLSNSMDPDRSDGFCNADYFDHHTKWKMKTDWKMIRSGFIPRRLMAIIFHGPACLCTGLDILTYQRPTPRKMLAPALFGKF